MKCQTCGTEEENMYCVRCLERMVEGAESELKAVILKKIIDT